MHSSVFISSAYSQVLTITHKSVLADVSATRWQTCLTLLPNGEWHVIITRHISSGKLDTHA